MTKTFAAAVSAFANVNHGLSDDSAVAAVESLVGIVADADLVNVAFAFARALQDVIVDQELAIIKAIRATY